jgi:small subunit ribosomal protein S16
LQRHGKKNKAFFHLVAADSRAKRDGKFIEKLGTYNPNTNPATIEINFDKTLHWVQVGAEMSETARAILSYKGVLHKNHLLNGVKKGALTTEQAEEKFAAWLAEKDAKVTGKVDTLAKNEAADRAARMKAEEVANAAKAAAVEAKNAPVVEEVEEAPVAEEATEVTETVVEETPVVEAAEEVEAVVEETPAVEAAEEVAAVVEETPEVEEATETPAEEAGEETPAAE